MQTYKELTTDQYCLRKPTIRRVQVYTYRILDSSRWPGNWVDTVFGMRTLEMLATFYGIFDRSLQDLAFHILNKHWQEDGNSSGKS